MSSESEHIIRGMSGAELDELVRRGWTLRHELLIRWHRWIDRRLASAGPSGEVDLLELVARREEARLVLQQWRAEEREENRKHRPMRRKLYFHRYYISHKLTRRNHARTVQAA